MNSKGKSIKTFLEYVDVQSAPRLPGSPPESVPSGMNSSMNFPRPKNFSYVDLDDIRVIDDINNHLNVKLSEPMITPYVALERSRKVLAPYGIVIPAVAWMNSDEGEQVFPVYQWGGLYGTRGVASVDTDLKTNPTYSVYFSWAYVPGKNAYDIYCAVVTQEELNDLLTTDFDGSPVPYDDDKNTEQSITYPNVNAAVFDEEKKKLTRTKIDEDDDPCWDDYRMVGMKKKGGREVPNCVPKKGVPKMRKEDRARDLAVASGDMAPGGINKGRNLRLEPFDGPGGRLEQMRRYRKYNKKPRGPRFEALEVFEQKVDEGALKILSRQFVGKVIAARRARQHDEVADEREALGQNPETRAKAADAYRAIIRGDGPLFGGVRKEEVDQQIDEAYTVELKKTERPEDVTDDIGQPVKAVDRHYDIHDENGKKVGEVQHHYNQYGGHFFDGHIHGSNIPYDRQRGGLKQNAQAFINDVGKTKWHSKLLERVAKRQQKQQQKEEVEQMDEASNNLPIHLAINHWNNKVRESAREFKKAIAAYNEGHAKLASQRRAPTREQEDELINHYERAQHHHREFKKRLAQLSESKNEDINEGSAAWQRKEGKNPEGGLNRKGVESYRRENPGSKLQMAVTTKPSKLKPGSKAAKRRKSFCARMGGMPGPMKDEKGRPTRKALSLRKWNC